MSEPMRAVDHVDSEHEPRWTGRLVLFLRMVACVLLLKGVYHWSLILGIGDGGGSTFEASGLPWQAATIYFAVIDPVAAVGLWLTAAWGGVLWLTAAISMAAIEYFFPDILGGQNWVIAAEGTAILIYFFLAIMAARDREN